MQTENVQTTSNNWWKLVLTWSFVGIPLAWGIVQTGVNALKLFE
jgi:hypothetical protein